MEFDVMYPDEQSVIVLLSLKNQFVLHAIHLLKLLDKQYKRQWVNFDCDVIMQLFWRDTSQIIRSK
jgi:hypothetical protein